MEYSSTWDTSVGNVRTIWIDETGTKMYTLHGGLNDVVRQYTLSTPWVVSSASFDDSVSVSSSANTTGMSFKPDGSIMYTAGATTEKGLHQYTLSTPFDITTASHDYKRTTTVSSTYGCHVSYDGTMIWTGSYTGEQVVEFTMSTPWDLTTATETAIKTVTGIAVTGITMSSDGSKMFLSNFADNTIHQWSMSVPFDISTATDDSIPLDLTTEMNSPFSPWFRTDGTNNDGTTVYYGDNDNNIYTFTNTQP